MVTRIDVSEALDRVIEALAGASEDEVTTVPAAVGASRPRLPARSDTSRMPLPRPGGSLRIVSDVEWV